MDAARHVWGHGTDGRRYVLFIDEAFGFATLAVTTGRRVHTLWFSLAFMFALLLLPLKVAWVFDLMSLMGKRGYRYEIMFRENGKCYRHWAFEDNLHEPDAYWLGRGIG